MSTLKKQIFGLLLLCSYATVASLWSVANAGDAFLTAEHYVDHTSVDSFYTRQNVDPRVSLYVREVVADGGIESAVAAGKVILLVHGATFPSTVAFDLQVGNASMMRELANDGWDVFALDLEGYGNSTRPEVMDTPDAYPDEPAPITPTVTVADVAVVVDFIRDLRGIDKVHMLGWSAGAMIEVPRYASEHPETVRKIVLYGTKFRGKERGAEEIAKRVRSMNSKKNRIGDPTSVERWASLGTTAEMLIPGLFAAYTEAHLASDPLSASLGDKIRAPFGRFVDITTERVRVHAQNITVPTLIIRGELDEVAQLDDNQALLDALPGEGHELVTIEGGGHFLHMENVSTEFYAALKNFLNK